MKKVLALALCLVLCLTVCACGGNLPKENNVGNGINLDNALAEGKIPELDIALGTNVDSIDMGEHSHEADAQPAYYLINGKEESYLMGENAYYYYKNNKKEAGISSIVSISAAFGLICGNYETPESVKNAFSNIVFTESVATEDDLFFLKYTIENCKKLSYVSGNREIVFIFEDNNLIAVNMVDINNWKN